MRIRVFFISFLMCGFSSLCNAFVSVPYNSNLNQTSVDPLNLVTFAAFLILFFFLAVIIFFIAESKKVKPQENIKKQEATTTEEARPNESISIMDDFEIDPVVEADTFLAFGRYVQAKEILVDALIKDPGNIKFKLKLLEIYSHHRDVISFNETLLSLSGDIKPDTEGWDKLIQIASNTDLPVDLSSLINDKGKEIKKSPDLKKENKTDQGKLLQGLSEMLSKIKDLASSDNFKKATIDVKERKSKTGTTFGYTIIIKID